MKFNIYTLFIYILCSVVIVNAQKTWEKSYSKWSKDEAIKVISDSPWAQSYQSAEASAATAQIQSSQEQNDQRIMGRTETGRSSRSLGAQPVVFRLHSALLIRQALLRLQQIQADYDKMSEAERSKFDNSSKDFLDCSICKNYYVITLTKFVKAAGQGVDEGMFQTLKFEDLKGKVRLINDKNEQRDLAQFVAPKRPGESAVLFFQRKDEKGNLLINSQTKEFALIFSTDFRDNSNNPYGFLVPRKMEFKVSKLVVGEDINF